MEQRDLVGETLLGYEVVSQIGSGTFGTVYKAVKSNALGRYVRALKHITLPTRRQYASVLNSMGGDTAKADGYFAEMLNGIASEISLLSSLSEKRSAHIVRYYESDLETQSSPLRYDVYMLMEYATPLMDHIEQMPSFTVGDAIRVGIDVLEGIAVCHDNGVIHRDIKEDNIFVSSEGGYEIGDFGVSKVLKDSSRAESLKGTPNYLAPEVYLNKRGYNKSVDLYALGIVLYRLLNHGRSPFLPPFPESYLAEDEDAAFEQRMRGLLAPPPALGSEAIHRVILKAISDEENRYQDARSFSRDLTAALEEAPEPVLEEQIGYSTVDASASNEDTFGSVGESQGTIRVGFGQAMGEATSAHDEIIADVSSGGHQSYSSDESTIPSATSQEQPASEAANEGTVRSATSLEEADEHLSNGSTLRYEQMAAAREDRATKNKTRDKTSTIILAAVMVVSSVIALLTYSGNPVLAVVGAACALASLIGLLFFSGHSIHGRGEANSSALMLDDEPYLTISDARFALSSSLGSSQDPQAAACIKELERLEERFQSEAKFGYGNAQATVCENEIAGLIKRMARTVPAITVAGGKLDALREDIRQVNHLLDKRRALLRR